MSETAEGLRKAARRVFWEAKNHETDLQAAKDEALGDEFYLQSQLVELLNELSLLFNTEYMRSHLRGMVLGLEMLDYVRNRLQRPEKFPELTDKHRSLQRSVGDFLQESTGPDYGFACHLDNETINSLSGGSTVSQLVSVDPSRERVWESQQFLRNLMKMNDKYAPAPSEEKPS